MLMTKSAVSATTRKMPAQEAGCEQLLGPGARLTYAHDGLVARHAAAVARHHAHDDTS